MTMTKEQAISMKNALSELAKSPLVACGGEKLTIDSTAGGKALATIPSGAKYALIVVESDVTASAAIRYFESTTTTVTASIGIPRSHGDAFDISGGDNLAGFRAIQTTAGTHALNVQYYK